MTGQYQFVRIHDHFFCLQQNLAVLMWILFFKKDIQFLNKDTLNRLIRSYPEHLLFKVFSWLRYGPRRFKNKVRIIGIFLKYKLKLKKSQSVIELPFYGHICLPVHRGHKIFDVWRESVIKIFDKDVPRAYILNEIEQLQKASKLNYTPTLRRWHIDEKWYEESYLGGLLDWTINSDTEILLEKFHKDICPYLENLVFSQSLLANNLKAYLNEIMEVLKAIFSEWELITKEKDEIKRFVYSIAEELNAHEDCHIHLVFTHGDFCPSNILNTKKGIHVIDWEGAKYRSALFDFYSYFFFRPYSNRLSVMELIHEINHALPVFLSRLSLKAPETTQNILSLPKIYRLLYYIERVVMLLEREMTDRNLNIKEKIIRYIDVFLKYEELCSETKIQEIQREKSLTRISKCI